MLQSIEEVGMEKGIDIGIREGFKEGFKEGIEEARRETARNLLLLNLLTEKQIAQVTNLNLEEVRRFKQEMESASPE
jgi:flagellar biosynthesis/type III secretory pathway protein FliH